MPLTPEEKRKYHRKYFAAHPEVSVRNNAKVLAKYIVSKLDAENFVISQIIRSMIRKDIKRVPFVEVKTTGNTPINPNQFTGEITKENLIKLKEANKAKKMKLQEEFGL